jgi:integrase
VIRKRRDGLQVQVYAGRDPLTGRKRYVSQQVTGQTRASMRQAKQIEARLLEEVSAGRHAGTGPTCPPQRVRRNGYSPRLLRPG